MIVVVIFPFIRHRHGRDAARPHRGAGCRSAAGRGRRKRHGGNRGVAAPRVRELHGLDEAQIFRLIRGGEHQRHRAVPDVRGDRPLRAGDVGREDRLGARARERQLVSTNRNARLAASGDPLPGIRRGSIGHFAHQVRFITTKVSRADGPALLCRLRSGRRVARWSAYPPPPLGRRGGRGGRAGRLRAPHQRGDTGGQQPTISLQPAAAPGGRMVARAPQS